LLLHRLEPTLPGRSRFAENAGGRNTRSARQQEEEVLSTELVFKAAFFALFIALLVVRGFFGWRAKQAGHCSWFAEEEAVEREGWWSILLRLVTFLGLLVLVVVYAVGPAKPGWLTIPLPEWLRWVGVGLASVSLPLLIWVHSTLQGYWSTTLQLRESHILITGGPYRWVRHPMYAALLLLFTGLSLASAVWPFLLMAVLMIPFFGRIAMKEEAMMIERFGDEYRSYMQRSGRFLPRLRTR
jgi:protein-S-isoprenylcysteine O-methyltransferase Ste14